MKNFILFLILLPCFMHAQDAGTVGKIVTNFKGFEIGYSYPYLTHSKKNYRLTESHYNGGLKAGMSWGRHYNSGISIAVSPSFWLCSIGKTVHESNYSGIKPPIRIVKYRNLSVGIPATIEFPFLFFGRINAGVFLALPLESSGKHNSRDLHLTILPDFNRDNFNSSDDPKPRTGFTVRYIQPIIDKNSRQHFIALEYMYFASHNYQTESRERWITFSYIHRQLTVKEKRHKWDRYLLKKQEN